MTHLVCCPGVARWTAHAEIQLPRQNPIWSAEPVTLGVISGEARAPEGARLYAIGDVHGCADLLARMHEAIATELARDRPADWRIIHLGDYCDRGPDTRGVLDQLVEVSTDPHVISLMGNHDAGWLNFLAEPLPHGLFVDNGGETTCRSYGVTAGFGSAEGLERTRQELSAALPSAHRRFLETLRRSASFGDYFFCHAGIRPGVPLDSQDPEDLIWIRNEFLRSTAIYAKVVVHGHTPGAQPQLLPNRINVDTGAFKTGILTAVVLEGTSQRILQVV